MIKHLSCAVLFSVLVVGIARADEEPAPPTEQKLTAEQVIAARVASRMNSPLAAELTPRLGDDPTQLPTVTPEMWMYLQEMQRYDNPRQAVRRKAQQRAAQRRARIESRKWFGYSNQRPQASCTPFNDHYSPTWSGNGAHPYQWVGGGLPTTTIRVITPARTDY